MWDLQVLMLSVIQCIILIGFPWYFCQLTVTRKLITQSFLYIILPGVLLLYFIGVYAMLYVVIGIGIFIYRRKRNGIAILHLLASIVLAVLADHLASFFIYRLFSDSQFFSWYPSLQLVCFIIILIIFAVLYRRGVTYFEKITLPSRYIPVLIVLLLIMTILFMYANIVKMDDSFFLKAVEYNLIFFFVYIMIFIVIVVFIIRLSFRHLQIQQKEQEIEGFMEYVHSLELINRDMRKFKHDYMNILTSMRHFIDDRDYDGLEQYFYEHILQAEKKELDHEVAVTSLNRLHINSLKGLLTTKLIQAQAASIPVHIEIVEDIKHINIDIISLNRIFGILLDNAIEASKDVNKPYVHLAFIQMEQSVLFVCMNRRDINQAIKIHEIYQEGYSTKAQGRGLGLAILRQMANETKNLSLNTKLNGDLFIQELEVQKE
ncbi:GHKL domain-containing protein [Bacillus cereus]|uniref:sensor histidine kinase n=2 Tax=Bacillaceae TaxID=186817 RepID=UPI000942A3B2|nr:MULTISPECIES: GHKL domain-containing protein [Bacillus cereus group]MDA1547327.1 GHKL domain-containing protein [Bacillus cereus group sp. TH253LC]MDA1581477.1 GHKL domain-containing protein [Bacillus cereus group sp. TH228LC]MDA1631013.1 GHKL domain-containing protein [Bacillus cereus group sp. TH172LC]MEC3469945.1 GHKL domain-containing protein [Bacillus tropicus]